MTLSIIRNIRAVHALLSKNSKYAHRDAILLMAFRKFVGTEFDSGYTNSQTDSIYKRITMDLYL